MTLLYGLLINGANAMFDSTPYENGANAMFDSVPYENSSETSLNEQSTENFRTGKPALIQEDSGNDTLKRMLFNSIANTWLFGDSYI